MVALKQRVGRGNEVTFSCFHHEKDSGGGTAVDSISHDRPPRRDPEQAVVRHGQAPRQGLRGSNDLRFPRRKNAEDAATRPWSDPELRDEDVGARESEARW